jgi:predicted ribosome quality control (RQC) complex YloA/Tae2 family protein
MDEVVVTNWYADPPNTLTIPLDPSLLPQQNAERCFVRARKIRRGAEHRLRRLAETAAESAWLDDLVYALGEAETATELEAINAELRAAGLLKSSRLMLPRRSSAIPAALLQTTSPGGFRLLWGKNRQGNARVSRQEAAADDLWFHACGLPGCHLVLKRDGYRGEIPELDRLYAASLSAGYSQGQGSAKVEVMMAEGKAVSPPKGALPGQVTVRAYTTLLVAPRRLETVA